MKNKQSGKKTHKKVPNYLLVMLSLNAATAIAAEPNKPSLNMQVKEIEVTATPMLQDGYQATKTRVGKTLQDPQDIPQAVTTLTRQLMKEQQVDSLKDALRNVSGLTFNAAEGGRSGDNMMLRGFYTFGDIYLDGIRDTAQYSRETFNLEQVDVLRGSAAMLFGRGQAGGVINQVSKLAKLEDRNVVTASIGNNHYRQLTGDFTKQLGETTAIRANVMDRYEETYRKNPANGDHPEYGRAGIAFSFGTGIGTENELYLSHSYTKTDDVPDYGVAFLNKKPINTTVTGGKINDGTFYGGSQNFDDSNTNVTTGVFTHQFSKDTEIRTQLRKASYTRSYWTKTPSTTSLPNATLGVGGNPNRISDYDTFTLQSDISTHTKLLGMRHTILAGVEYLDEDSYRHALRNIGTTAAPIYRADSLALRVAGVNRGYNQFDSVSKSYYGQDSIEFIPNWTYMLGARRDYMDANYTRSVGSTVNDASSELSYRATSYRTGLSWQPSNQAHYYISYSDSFSPTADLYQQTIQPLPPETSQTTEIGAKWLFFDGDLAFRTALYQSIKNWERNTDLESTAAILTKKRRTNGLEFELAGRVNDKLEVFGGLALMDAVILEVAQNVDATTGAITNADARFKGQRARNTAPVTLNFWGTYKLSTNWKLGGGFEAKAERYGYSPSQIDASALFVNGEFVPNTLPGYVRLDAMVSYEARNWAVRFNLKNLLDKTYYDAIYDNGGFSVPGNGRQAIITTEYRF